MSLHPAGPAGDGRNARHLEALAPLVEPWPQADASFDLVLIPDVLAHVIADQHALDQAARVLRPGGRLVVRVPYRGPLAWLDPPNAYRYVSDATRRGPNPPETRGIGWRRHYHRRELDAMLHGAGLRVTRVRGSGLGLAPALDLALMLLFRWLLPLEPVYRATRRATALVARGERLLPLGPLGYWLTVVAERPLHEPGDMNVEMGDLT
jgi:SAM-dependent methyltransferase